MKGIYEFYWDCGRQGDLSGLFIADNAEVEAVIGNTVYFGEILGKHSEVEGDVEAKDITLITDDTDFILKFETFMGTGTISGVNPVAIYQDQLEDEE